MDTTPKTDTTGQWKAVLLSETGLLPHPPYFFNAQNPHQAKSKATTWARKQFSIYLVLKPWEGYTTKHGIEIHSRICHFPNGHTRRFKIKLEETNKNNNK